MATPPSSSAPVTRRFSPPCWSKEETLALIQAYKDKWFALRRRNLKASDWGAVSAVVSSASDPETSKSSFQCRHKIEKLRQRYRAEKQRCLRNPGKFSSSWDLFPLLDSMNFASLSVDGSVDPDLFFYNKVCGFHWKVKNYEKIHGNYGSNLAFEHDFSGGCGPNFDFDHKFGDSNGVELQGNGDFVTQEIKRFKSNGRIGHDYGSMLDFDHSFSQGDDSVDRSLCFHQSKHDRVDRSFDHGVSHRYLNGFAAGSRPGIGVKKGSDGIDRGIDPVEETASSIKCLAEGFVMMEKMKIEMMKEIEKTRMEMEMKHNEMLLESQEKIIDIFAKALLE